MNQMTPDELDKAVRESHNRRLALHAKIIEAARAVIPVLHDSGRTRSAAQLEELFFLLDAELEAITKTVHEAGPDVFIETIKRTFRK